MRSTDGALWCDSRAVSGGGVINGGVTSDAVIGVGSSGWCGRAVLSVRIPEHAAEPTRLAGRQQLEL